MVAPASASGPLGPPGPWGLCGVSDGHLDAMTQRNEHDDPLESIGSSSMSGDEHPSGEKESVPVPPLDKDPPPGKMPSDADVQAERRP